MRSLRHSVFGIIVAILVMAGVLVAAAGLWFRNAVYIDRSLPQRTTTVIIPRGSSFAHVTALLTEHHVVAHPLAFRLLARFRRNESAVKAGEFRFEPHASSDAILRQLIEGGAQVAGWLTIPEGYTAHEIANVLAGDRFGNASAFERAFLTSSITIGGARSRSLEGYLFPDTYLVPLQTSPASVAQILTEQFRHELPSDAVSRARKLGYTIPQIVTIASLIEREAKSDDERALMAGVYYNRLRRKIPLQVDATIEYVFPSHKTVITNADLRIDSPYNTYRYAGLPPTPIASPGRPSLVAALNPEPSDFLYYVYKGNGHHAFAKTLSEHNANVARYLK